MVTLHTKGCAVAMAGVPVAGSLGTLLVMLRGRDVDTTAAEQALSAAWAVVQLHIGGDGGLSSPGPAWAALEGHRHALAQAVQWAVKASPLRVRGVWSHRLREVRSLLESLSTSMAEALGVSPSTVKLAIVSGGCLVEAASAWWTDPLPLSMCQRLHAPAAATKLIVDWASSTPITPKPLADDLRFAALPSASVVVLPLAAQLQTMSTPPPPTHALPSTASRSGESMYSHCIVFGAGHEDSTCRLVCGVAGVDSDSMAAALAAAVAATPQHDSQAALRGLVEVEAQLPDSGSPAPTLAASLADAALIGTRHADAASAASALPPWALTPCQPWCPPWHATFDRTGAMPILAVICSRQLPGCRLWVDAAWCMAWAQAWLPGLWRLHTQPLPGSCHEAALHDQQGVSLVTVRRPDLRFAVSLAIVAPSPSTPTYMPRQVGQALAAALVSPAVAVLQGRATVSSAKRLPPGSSASSVPSLVLFAAAPWFKERHGVGHSTAAFMVTGGHALHS